MRQLLRAVVRGHTATGEQKQVHGDAEFLLKER